MEAESSEEIRQGCDVEKVVSFAPAKCFVTNPQWLLSPSMGSRFWALNGDYTSDEDEAGEEEGEVGLKLDSEVEECVQQGESFVQRALKQGFTADEI